MPTPGRVERRRAEREQRIMRIAARRFARDGVDGVRLDEIADEADIARATFYSHFETKEALVEAIVRPTLEDALRQARGLRDRSPRLAVRKLLKLYLQLWKDHPDAMCIGHRMQQKPAGGMSELHQQFMRHVLRVFGQAATAGLLRAGDPMLASMLLARLAIPMLQTYVGRDQAEELFLQSMDGMLLSAGA
jgi:AcrR family transcriptional regulator